MMVEKNYRLSHIGREITLKICTKIFELLCLVPTSKIQLVNTIIYKQKWKVQIYTHFTLGMCDIYFDNRISIIDKFFYQYQSKKKSIIDNF